MNEQDKFAYWERFRDMGQDERLFEIAVALHDLSAEVRDENRPPCARLKRLIGNGKLGWIHYQWVCLALLTVSVLGKDAALLVAKLFFRTP